MLGTLNQADRLRCPVRSGDPVGPGSRSTRSRLGRAYVAAGVFMIPWVLFLSRTLPAGATDCHWALAWVGVDSSEALVLAATATAVLLLTDAWLDLTSAAPGGELLTAIAMAVFAEVPIALACVALALRLIRHPFPSAAETAGTDKYEE